MWNNQNPRPPRYRLLRIRRLYRNQVKDGFLDHQAGERNLRLRVLWGFYYVSRLYQSGGGKVLNPWNISWLAENSAILVPVPTHSEDSSKTRSYYPGVVPLKWSGYPIFRNFNGDIQFPVFWLDHISIWIGKNTLVELIKIIFLLFWLSKTNENDKCVLSGPPPPWKLCWISKNTWYSANF